MKSKRINETANKKHDKNISILPSHGGKEQRGKEVVMVVISDPNVEIYSVKIMFQTARKIIFFVTNS